jgi:hypothetical protein
MVYDYKTERNSIFTEEGLNTLLKIRDAAHGFLEHSGAATMGKLIAVTSGDSWFLMACVDMLVERGELAEVTEDGCPGQFRVFVRGK